MTPGPNMEFPEHSPPVSVIVVSHNEGGWLKKTVDNLAGTIPPAGEIVVVDDCSTDGSAKQLLSRNRIRILRPNRRLGAAGARNFGARHACGRILVFCDAHIEAPHRWFPPLRAVLARPTVGAVGPAFAEMKARDMKGYGLRIIDAGLNWTWLDRLTSSPYEVPMLGGFFLGLRRDVFFEVGGFDPGFAVWGMEDMEFVMRIWSFGYQCMLLPDVEVAHLSREADAYPEYQLNWHRGLQNTLRVAALHFGELRLRRVFCFYGNDPYFPAALAGLVVSNAWEKRAAIHARRMRDDEWLFQRFGMVA
jgi:GT2 family glycosyltransferase